MYFTETQFEYERKPTTVTRSNYVCLLTAHKIIIEETGIVV